jgi:predicted trehalose synthase
MLRSCDYAVETAHADDGADAAAVARQGQRLRGSFLAGYLLAAAERDRGVLPRDRVVLNAWIDFFEVEKALYEVEYEINNRPTWVHIPLGGIVRILERHV